MATESKVIVVGAGIAGLCCAKKLSEAGIRPLVLEASDAVGGRVRTDSLDGFLLDRGFQVLLSAYPEAQEVLDYDRLDLRRFTPGALVWTGRQMERVADPLRCPGELWSTLRADIGTLGDKLRMARLRRAVRRGLGEERSTEQALRDFGFSERIIDTLFRPWFGGVFLDRSLGASSRAFEFTFQMFSSGDTAVPASGMAAIPAQIAEGLPEGTIRLHASVDALTDRGVRLKGGEELSANGVVIATDAPTAAQLLDAPAPPTGRGVRTVFFDAPEPPVRGPILILDGTGAGPVNDLCVMSEVSSAYAPAGRALVSISVLDHVELDGDALVRAAQDQVSAWFGESVRKWRHLRTIHVRHALPSQVPDTKNMISARKGVYVCGDHCDRASLQGAMVSGRNAASAILRDLSA
ncbi:MAG: phytoene dehydrogenase-like protein [Planctomycetota bacterium]|jgi:phytoene dehydrogenase-like protein